MHLRVCETLSLESINIFFCSVKAACEAPARFIKLYGTTSRLGQIRVASERKYAILICIYFFAADCLFSPKSVYLGGGDERTVE